MSAKPAMRWVPSQCAILTRFVRLRPFDTTTESGRANERHRRAALAVIGSAIAKASAIGAAFISVPLTIRYLGTERYGMWMTITSISGILAFSDFGMGNGLLSAVAGASGREDRNAATRSVTSAFFMLTAIAATALCLLAACYPIVPWGRLLNLTSPMANAEAGPTAAVFVACFALNLPLGIAQRIQMAYQETFQSNLWQSLGSLAGFIALICAITFRAGLPSLVAAFSGAPVVANALNLWVEFKFRRPWLAPRPRFFDWRSSKKLLSTGFAFVSIQVGSCITFSSDNFIIAQLLGPTEVARYSVGARLFSLINLMPQILFTPLWPAYGEAYARGDMTWIRKTLKRTALLGLALSVGAGCCLLVVSPWFIGKWTRGAVSLPFGLMLALCASAIVFCSTYPHGILLYGLNALRFSTIAMTLVAISSVGLKLLMIPLFGLSGAAWGTVLSYLVFNTLPILYYAPRLLTEKSRT